MKRKNKRINRLLSWIFVMCMLFTNVAPSIAMAAQPHHADFSYVTYYGLIRDDSPVSHNLSRVNMYFNSDGTEFERNDISIEEFSANHPNGLDDVEVAYCLDMNSEGPTSYEEMGTITSETILSEQPLYGDQDFSDRVSRIIREGYPGNSSYWQAHGCNTYEQYVATQISIWSISGYFQKGNNGSGNEIWDGLGTSITADNPQIIEMAKHLCRISYANTDVDSIKPEFNVTAEESYSDNDFFYQTYRVSHRNFCGTGLGSYYVNFEGLPENSVINDGTVENGQKIQPGNADGEELYKVKIPKNTYNSEKTISFRAEGSVPTRRADSTYFFDYGQDYQHMALMAMSGSAEPYNGMASLTTGQINISIGVHKVSDADNNTKVSGAVYGLYRDEKCTDIIGRATTDKQGELVWKNINYGTYYVKEIESPEGYILSDETYKIGVDSYDEKTENYFGTTLYVKKVTDVPGFAAGVRKTTAAGDGKEVVSGAVYGLFSDAKCKKLISEATTNKYGYAVWGDLDIRKTYYAKEIKAPAGYIISNEVFTISREKYDHMWSGGKWHGYDMCVVEAKDLPQAATIDILLQKIDAVTGSNVPSKGLSLEGAVYTVKEWLGTDSVPGDEKPDYTWEFKTDKNGVIKLGESYRTGGDDLYYDSKGKPAIPVGVITVQEKKAPAGYNINEKVYTRVISASEGGENDGIYVAVKTGDTPITGGAELVKTSVDGLQLVKGAVYGLYGSGDEKIGEYTTDSDGKIRVEGLIWGDYYFKEIEAAPGYELSDAISRFTVDGKEDGIVENVSTSDNYIYKKVIITKKIKVEDIWFDHGNPQFIINLKGVDINGEEHEYNRLIEFTRDYVKKHMDSDGYASMQVTFDNLVPGVYTASEMDVIRYKFGSISDVSNNGTVNGAKVEFNLRGSYKKGTATYVNEKYEWQQYSATASMVNQIVEKKPDAQISLYGVFKVDNTIDVKGFTDIDDGLLKFTVNGVTVSDFSNVNKIAVKLTKPGINTFRIAVKDPATGTISRKIVQVNVADRK